MAKPVIRIAATADELRLFLARAKQRVVYVEALDSFFEYDKDSTDSDDGETAIRPSNIDEADPGRWVKVEMGGGGGGDTPTVRLAELLLNGSTVIGKASLWIVNGQVYLNVTALRDLAEGDYVEVVCYQNSGGDKSAGDSESFFGLQQLAVGSDHGALVTAGSQTTVPTATLTPVEWFTESYDTDAYHDAGAKSKFTVGSGRAGKYLITATILL